MIQRLHNVRMPKLFISNEPIKFFQKCNFLSEENKKLIKLLENLNTNIEVLSKVTALTFRKDSLFKGKETKQEQIEELEGLKIPDNIIALIIGSTTESVQALRSQRKAKTEKVSKTVSAEPAKEPEGNKQ
jgi:predicted transcriptional regulator